VPSGCTYLFGLQQCDHEVFLKENRHASLSRALAQLNEALHNTRRDREVFQWNAHSATPRTFVRIEVGKVSKDTFALIANDNF
jgi:hypothetical protein